MITYTRHPDYTEARIVLADGETAGTGYGPTEASAAYFAARDARLSDDPRHQTAGRGHARTLAPGPTTPAVLPTTTTPEIKVDVVRRLLDGETVQLGRWTVSPGRDGVIQIRMGGDVVWTPRTVAYAAEIFVDSWLRDW